MSIQTIFFQAPSATSFVANFTIIYLRMGFPRLSAADRCALLPSLLPALEGKPTSHQDSLLLLVLPDLAAFPAPEDEDRKRTALGLADKPQVAKLFSSFLLDYLLLPYGSHPSLVAPPPPGEPEDPTAPTRIHPGLSEASWKRVAGETPVKAEVIERNKIGVVKFLGKGLLDGRDLALQLAVALSDTRHSVSSEAESQMRRLSSSLDWEDPAVVAKLYSLFLGTIAVKDKTPVKPELRRAPAGTRIRLKLMPLMLRSREAASHFPACVQVIFDLLFGKGGNSNAKLRTHAVAFVHHVIECCPGERLSAIGGVLLSAMVKLSKEEERDAKLRASCYVAIGKLGQRVPALVNKDATMLQTFFDAISREDEETQLSVQEAMALMAPSFRTMDRAKLSFLEAMLASYIEKEEPKVRLVTVQYAGEVFPPDHVPTRFILMLGAGDQKDEVASAARSHLLGPLKKYRQQQDTVMRKYHQTKEELKREELLPDFEAMLRHTMGKVAIRLKSKEKVMVGEKVLPYYPSVCLEIVGFLRMCLLNSSGILPSADCLEDAEAGAPQVSKYLAGLCEEKRGLVGDYIEFAERLLDASHGRLEAKAMLQVIGCCHKMFARQYSKKLTWIKNLLTDSKEDVRDSAAHVFGLVCAELGEEEFDRAVSAVSKGFKERALELQHGIIMSLAYSFGRRILLTKEGGKDAVQSGSYAAAVDLVYSQLGSQHPMGVGSACAGIAELGRCGPLPLQDGEESEEMEDVGKSKLAVVKELLKLLKAGKTPMKTRERAALALGNLCVGDPSFPHRQLVLKELLGCAQEVKDIELHFTMGEAVYCAMAGPLAPRGRDQWRQAEEDFCPSVEETASDQYIKWTLDEFCNKLAVSTHPNVKQASCLWLLAVVKYGSGLKAVERRLMEVQAAFMALLGDGNDIVQDAASKGLGLVYENSSEEDRERLVGSLLGTLTADRSKEVQKVSGETKIFDEGQMGKTPTGGNLTTYKELCSLATDLNQPDLVYKFMNLANNNAMWNSRRGAAFGFSSIAAKAGEQMEKHLPKIVPKLYRYQFDPTPKIQVSFLSVKSGNLFDNFIFLQESMASIWSALVPETSKTLDKYLPEILEELCTNLTNNQWRVRESCCLAVVDLLRGRSLDGDALARVPDLWHSLFRVMDDIKESVRTAAGKAADSLSRTCIRMCDAAQSGKKSSEAATEVVLPSLLEDGLQVEIVSIFLLFQTLDLGKGMNDRKKCLNVYFFNQTASFS